MAIKHVASVLLLLLGSVIGQTLMAAQTSPAQGGTATSVSSAGNSVATSSAPFVAAPNDTSSATSANGTTPATPVSTVANGTTSATPVSTGVNGTTSATPVSTVANGTTPATPVSTGANGTTSATPVSTGANGTTSATPVSTGANGTKSATPVSTGANGTKSATPVSTGANGTTSAAPVSTGANGTTSATPVSTGANVTTSTTPVSTGVNGTTSVTPLTGVAASTTAGAVAPPAVCSQGYCKNLGTCFINGGLATCICPAGYGGVQCDSLIREYKISISANDELGNPMAYSAALCDSKNPGRDKLEARLCAGVTRAFLASRTPVFSAASFSCSLLRCYEGSLRSDLNTSATFSPSASVAPTPADTLAALSAGLTATNATFGYNPAAYYGDPCAAGSSSLCPRYATCLSSSGTYSCACSSGYADANPSSPGTSCTQLCTSSSCPATNQVCVQNAGSAISCQCGGGYSGADCSQHPLWSAIIGLIVTCGLLLILLIIVLGLCIMSRRGPRRQRLRNEETTAGSNSYTMVDGMTEESPWPSQLDVSMVDRLRQWQSASPNDAKQYF